MLDLLNRILEPVVRIGELICWGLAVLLVVGGVWLFLASAVYCGVTWALHP